MVVLFPLGAILVRVLPAGRIALWTHGLVQMAAVGALVAAAALGVQIATEVNEGTGMDLVRPDLFRPSDWMIADGGPSRGLCIS